MTTVKVKFVTVNGYPLYKIRLWFFSLSLLNLLVTTAVALTIDLSLDPDPIIQNYERKKWFLLTTWYNLGTMFYIPFCMFCDWREKNGDQSKLLGILMKFRDIVMTSVLFPVTVYADIVFWIIFTECPWVLAPVRIFEMVPYWTQHSTHTVSLVFVVLDLVLTPRHRPKRDKVNLAVLCGFCFVYVSTLYTSYLLGDPVYMFLATASRVICVPVVFCSIVMLIICYYAQWPLIEYIWGPNNVKFTVNSHSFKSE